MKSRFAFVTCLALLAISFPANARANNPHFVPFKGSWAGATVSAVPTDDPAIVAVVTAGDGVATHLGHFTMVSPHNSHLDTLAADGLQLFEAANGDQLTAEFTGQFMPTPDGFLEGVLDCTVTGGTGRFAGVRGSYVEREAKDGGQGAIEFALDLSL